MFVYSIFRGVVLYCTPISQSSIEANSTGKYTHLGRCVMWWQFAYSSLVVFTPRLSRSFVAVPREKKKEIVDQNIQTRVTREGGRVRAPPDRFPIRDRFSCPSVSLFLLLSWFLLILADLEQKFCYRILKIIWRSVQRRNNDREVIFYDWWFHWSTKNDFFLIQASE